MKNVDWSKWNTKTDNFQRYAHVTSHLIYGEPLKDPGLASIVILTHKRAHGLKVAIDSAIAQDYKEKYAITVVDDSGFDQATDDLMREYCSKYASITYYRHEQNIGQYASWNRACELSPTDWFCLLHDDDYLEKNYLTEIAKVLKDPQYQDVGLIGVYFTTVDNRKEKKTSIAAGVIKFLTNVFIKLRNKKPIKITLDDNVRLIYVLSCCLMINKSKVIELGGLDDNFFPSADFALSSKMNYYYSTLFLPEYLCYRGIGENESLKQEVCEDSITCAYHHTVAMLKTTAPGMSKEDVQKKASFAAVAAEIGVLGYNNTDYSSTKRALGMPELYNKKSTRFKVMIKSRFYWGLLLLRNNKEMKK